MLKFSANLSFLYQDLPFVDRFAAAAADGFRAVEYVSPYDAGKRAISELLQAHDLQQVLFNLPAGDWDKGERGIACHPGRIEEFRKSIDIAIDFAFTLNCSQVNCLAGIVPQGISREKAWDVFIGNLAYAANHLAQESIRLLIEPINYFDMPGFLLNRTGEAMNAIELVNADNLFLQCDVYHMQRMEGELANTLARVMPRTAHIQIADNPGRHQPGTGEINYPFLFGQIEQLNYDRWIGCEYVPIGKTSASLGWMPQIR